MKKIISLALCLLMMTALLTGCGKKVVSTGTTSKSDSQDKEETKSAATTAPTAKGDYSMVLSGSYTALSDVPAADLSEIDTDYQMTAPKKDDVVAILHTNHGDISMRFFPEVAPKAVNNFIALAKAGKYDNTIFHRIISGFMMQGGDYTRFNGTGGESIYGEEFGLEISDYVLNLPGSVAMANTGMPDSNGSQFYINQGNSDWLNGSYTVFGQVYSGMDVVNEICEVQTDANNMPLEKVSLDSVEITTFQ